MDPKDRKYTNGEITVYWKPSECIHATTCYKELGRVFNPRKRPWVNMEGAPTDRIIDIIRKCPTNALTYDWINPDKESDKPGSNITVNESEEIMSRQGQPVEIRIMKNGPVVVETREMIFLCRCGNSANKPYCDGSHRRVNLGD